MLIRYAIRWRPTPNAPPMFLAKRTERGGVWVTIDGDMKTWHTHAEAADFRWHNRATIPADSDVAKIDLIDMKEIA